MIEFPVDVLWIIKTMTLRSIWNPNALVYTANSLMYAYLVIFFQILLLVVIFFLIKSTYSTIKKIRDNKKNWEILLIRNVIKEILTKEKMIFMILKYPTIWCILISTCRMYTSILLRYFEKFYEHHDVIRENLNIQESWVLGYRWTYVIFSFVLASYSIWLSFWNKMLRNIGILLFVVWIFLVIFLIFLNNWTIVNGLPNFTV